MKKVLIILMAAMVVVGSVGCKKEKVEPESGVLVYSANSNQSGTNAPVMTEMENTIGAIQWEYVSPGIYHGKLAGAFPLDKTFTLCNNGVDGYISADLRHWDPDFVELRTFAGTNGGSPQPSNGCGGISFEIRVYD